MKVNNFNLFGNVFSSTPKSRVNPLSSVKPTSKPVVITLPNEEVKTEEVKTITVQSEIDSSTENTNNDTTKLDNNNDSVEEVDTQTLEEDELKLEQESTSDEQPKKRRRRRTKAEMELAKQQETSKDPVEEVEDNIQQQESEEKPAKETVKKSDNKESEALAKEEEIKQINVKTPSKDFKFEEVIAKFVPVVEDPKWDEQVKYIEDQMNKIHFDSDINAGTIRVMLPLISNLYIYIKRIKPEYETLCEQLISDSIGLIPRQKLANSNGSNVEERKKNGTKSCENFKVETMKGTLNLYEFYGIALSRLNYLKAKIECLDFSKSSLIGFLTVITKAEK